MSLTPPNSAALFTSLTRISEIVPKDGNNSGTAASFRTLTVLMPSILTESMLGLEPATERPPLLSTWTPTWVVSVVIGLVDPAAREPIAIGRSKSSRDVFVSAMFETSDRDRLTRGGIHEPN